MSMPLRVPKLSNRMFATDSGLETTLIFKDGYDLPFFETFVLLKTLGGRARLRDYYFEHARIARNAGFGFILEAPTWRANPDWALRLGIERDELVQLNIDAIEFMSNIRGELEMPSFPIVVSGCIGPRGDGYNPSEIMTVQQARDYHQFQAQLFAHAGADMVTAMTITNIPEAVGLAQAAKDEGIACAISFTLETDGLLPTGDRLGSAIEVVDAATANSPAYYMINCAHPDHFMPVLEKGGQWLQRLKGLRANASRCSHVELDNSPTLDDGDPVELGAVYRDILARFPDINVVGGCCGTDLRHIEQIVGRVARAA